MVWVLPRVLSATVKRLTGGHKQPSGKRKQPSGKRKQPSGKRNPFRLTGKCKQITIYY